MKVSIDLRFLSAPGMGSATYQRALWEGLQTLAPEGYEWIAFGAPPDGQSSSLSGQPPSNGSGSWSYRPPPRRLPNAWNLLRLPLTLGSVRPTLHHATLNFQAPILCPCPVVVSLHDVIPIEHPDLVTRRYSLLFKSLLRPVLRRARRVLVGTEDVHERVARHYPRFASKLRVVPLGLPADFVEPLPEGARNRVVRAHELPTRYLLFIGPPEPRKNLPVILRALLQLGIEGASVPPLVMVGSTHLRDPELEDLKSRAGDQIIDLGRVPSDDLAAIIGGAAVLLFPTRAEGYGYPPLEALSRGVPVIASRLPVLEEVLGNDVVFCETFDVDAWAQAIVESLATDDGPRRDRGRARVRDLSAVRMAEKTLSIYQEVADELAE